MAKSAKRSDLLSYSKDCKEAFLQQADQLWEDYQENFFKAIEDAPNKKLQLVMKTDLDLSSGGPVVLSGLEFKDRDTEHGMEVTKTYRSPKERLQLPDPNQPELLGEGETADATVPAPAKKPRRAKKDK